MSEFTSDENFARVFEQPQKRAKLGSTDQDLMDNLSQSELMELWDAHNQPASFLPKIGQAVFQPSSAQCIPEPKKD